MKAGTKVTTTIGKLKGKDCFIASKKDSLILLSSEVANSEELLILFANKIITVNKKFVIKRK